VRKLITPLLGLMNKEDFYNLGLMERLFVLPWFTRSYAHLVKYVCVTTISHYLKEKLKTMACEDPPE
jgi:hypothetical protein